jgi:hypothetical protein
MSKKAIVIIAVAAAAAAAAAYYWSPANREARFIDELVARNLDARGGEGAWDGVTTMRMLGHMDLGQDLVVPYVLEQKRPGKMCFEFEFDNATSTQCTDGQKGWKIAPFRGRTEPEPMNDLEYREMAYSSDPYGLLYNYKQRNLEIDYLGIEPVDGHDAYKLQINLPGGGKRWLYLGTESALDIKLEMPRVIAGREFLVETVYSDWLDVEGLRIPGRQETRTGSDDEWHFLTVESVVVNPTIEDDRFHIPTAVNADPASGGSGS